MTFLIAPTLTGYPQPGVVWLPDQWAAMMSGQPALAVDMDDLAAKLLDATGDGRA